MWETVQGLGAGSKTFYILFPRCLHESGTVLVPEAPHHPLERTVSGFANYFYAESSIINELFDLGQIFNLSELQSHNL